MRNLLTEVPAAVKPENEKFFLTTMSIVDPSVNTDDSFS